MLYDVWKFQPPVTPSCVSTVFAQSCFEFSRVPWDIFSEKEASLQCSHRDQGVATELTWHSIPFLVGASLCSRNAFMVLTMSALGFLSVCTALTVCWRSTLISLTISVQMPWMTTAFAQPLCLPLELLLHCRRPYCVALATLQWPYRARIRTPSHCVCFELRCAPLFGILRNPTASNGDASAEMFAMVLLTPQYVLHFFFVFQGIVVRILLWCDRRFTDDCILIKILGKLLLEKRYEPWHVISNNVVFWQV